MPYIRFSSSLASALPDQTGHGGEFLTTDGFGDLSWGNPEDAGVTTVGTFSVSSQPNGASISGVNITFGPADATNPGMMSTGAQTFAGDKIWTGYNSFIVPVSSGSLLTFKATNADAYNDICWISSGGAFKGCLGYGNATGDVFASSFYLTTGTNVPFKIIWEGDSVATYIFDPADDSFSFLGPLKPNGAAGTSTNLLSSAGSAAPPTWVSQTDIGLPTQTGHSGEFLTTNGTVSSWTAMPAGGVTTVGDFSGSAQTNGASISGSTITFGPASSTVPGMVSTGTQSWAGAKTFVEPLAITRNADSTTSLAISNTNTGNSAQSFVTVTNGSAAGGVFVSQTGIALGGAIYGNRLILGSFSSADGVMIDAFGSSKTIRFTTGTGSTTRVEISDTSVDFPIGLLRSTLTSGPMTFTSLVANSGTNTAHLFNTTNALTGTTVHSRWSNQASEIMALSQAGNLSVAGNLTANNGSLVLSGNITTTTGQITKTGSSASFNFNNSRADGAGNIAFLFNNTTTLTTTAKLWAVNNNGTEKFSVHNSGKPIWEYTNNAGTPGNTTINQPSGRAAIANGASACVVTNSTVTATSIVRASLETAAAGVANVVVTTTGSGTFTVTSVDGTGVVTNTTADATFSFVVSGA